MNFVKKRRAPAHRGRIASTIVGLVLASAVVVATPQPATAEMETSWTGAAERTAYQCPQNTTTPIPYWTGTEDRPPPLNQDIWGPFPSNDCMIVAYQADRRIEQTQGTATAPVWWTLNGVHDVLDGEETDKDAVDFAMGLVGELVEQADSLVSLVQIYHEATVISDNRITFDTTVDGPTGRVVDRHAQVAHCLSLQCVSDLPNSLPGSIGCLPPSCGPTRIGTVLEVSTTGSHPATMATTSGGDDSITQFEWRNTVNMYNNPDNESGGPDKVSGLAAYHYYVQSYKFSEAWNFSASSQLYSASPVNNCKIKTVTSTVEPRRSTELSDWEPTYVEEYGSAGSRSVTAGLSGEKGGGSFSISRSWNVPQGIAGGYPTDDSRHFVVWKSPSKNGDRNTKSATGVETWKTPTGTVTSLFVYSSTVVGGC